MKIKICGIRSNDDINLINKYKPDYCGFIFFEKSKRFLKFNKAKELSKKVDNSIKKVGVFVDRPFSEIKAYIDSGIIDFVQLHGNETNELIKKIQDLNIPVIKAIRINNENDFDQIKKYQPDYFLFDVKSDKFIGGTGESFNWKLLKNYNKDIPFFLAGGINIDNIKDALKTNAYSLDISSAIEKDFIKDPYKTKELFEIYNIENELQ